MKISARSRRIGYAHMFSQSSKDDADADIAVFLENIKLELADSHRYAVESIAVPFLLLRAPTSENFLAYSPHASNMQTRTKLSCSASDRRRPERRRDSRPLAQNFWRTHPTYHLCNSCRGHGDEIYRNLRNHGTREERRNTGPRSDRTKTEDAVVGAGEPMDFGTC